VASVYFDTRSNKLRAAGISLRVRQIGDKRVQTIACGTFTQQEWEWEKQGLEVVTAFMSHFLQPGAETALFP
jgi:inorganic triphosphatase YgiF